MYRVCTVPYSTGWYSTVVLQTVVIIEGVKKKQVGWRPPRAQTFFIGYGSSQYLILVSKFEDK